MDVRPVKTQISLGIHPVWSESSLSAGRKLGSLATHWAHSKNSDQTGWIPRLIWVFAGRTCHFVGFCHEVANISVLLPKHRNWSFCSRIVRMCQTHTILRKKQYGQDSYGRNSCALKWFQPRHDKTNKMNVRPAKTQISQGICPVWSVFAVRMKKAWVLSYPLSAQRRLWSDQADAQADLSLRWAHSHFVGFVMSWLILGTVEFSLSFSLIIW